MPDYDAKLAQLRDSYNARDPEAFAAVWSTDCEWHPFLTARVEGDPGYHGHNGIRAWFEDVDEMFSEIQVELGESRQVGDRLLVLGQMTATGRGSGAPVSSEVGWIVEPRGDVFQRGWAYTSHSEAERAAQETA
ncbi:MAG TPA: nuclear transport factor 2 family protein [Solirubrobacterales bacterium]|nr:nuclear transport factor 2 family protein [Solirubrobacterales bacterium]